MSDEKKAESGAIGFAGLETFLSDFSKDANQATSGQHSTTDFGANTTAEGSTITGKNTNPPPKPKSTIIKSFRSLLIPLGIVGGIVIVVFIAAFEYNRMQGAPDYSTAINNSSDSTSEASTSTEANPPSYNEESSDIKEELPPVGTDNVLNNNQIAYCLSEKIRIEGMQSAVDDTNRNHIDTHNDAVNDYNARCSSFSYRTGSLEYVRSKVEERRYLLQNEGVLRIENSGSN